MVVSDTQGGTNGDLKSTGYGSSLSNNNTNSSRDGFIGLLDMFGFENAQVSRCTFRSISLHISYTPEYAYREPCKQSYVFLYKHYHSIMEYMYSITLFHQYVNYMPIRFHSWLEWRTYH